MVDHTPPAHQHQHILRQVSASLLDRVKRLADGWLSPPRPHVSSGVFYRRRAGPQGDRALLAPEERRDMNDYETKMQTAERVGRKARHQKTRSAAKTLYVLVFTHQL